MTPPAVGALTGLSEDDLGRWLREVRKVAALSDSAALAACDTLLWSYQEWHARRSEPRDSVPSDAQDAPDALDDRAYSLWMIAEDISRLNETMDRLRRQQAIPGSMPVWEPESLRRRAEAVGHLAGPEARAAAAEDIAKARQAAETLAAELDLTVHRDAIQEAEERVIVSTATVAAILGTVDRALAGLAKLGQVTDADRAAAKAAKLRAARWRSDRKFAEAEVAAGGGNPKKADRLRREGAIMLAQDLEKAGLGGPPPQREERPLHISTSQQARCRMALSAAERALLQRVANRDQGFGNQNVRDPAECARFDAEVKALQGLERRGLITLKLNRNHMSSHGDWYAAAPLITEAGTAALGER